MTRTCTKCGELKPVTAFTADKRKPGGLQHWCKDCRNAYNLQYHRANPAKSLLRGYKYKDKEKGLGNDLTEAFVTALMVLPCSYCATTKYQRGLDRLDNSLGHLQDNVVPCCQECNRVRSDVFTPEQMRRFIGPAISQARNLL